MKQIRDIFRISSINQQTPNAMSGKEKRMAQKREYEMIKDIRKRYEAGEPTTFAERNIMFIYLKKIAKKNAA